MWDFPCFRPPPPHFRFFLQLGHQVRKWKNAAFLNIFLFFLSKNL